ncbi:hypothetical protein C8R45DRAFT_1159552 [Mycena sanguinolenta]|nr:hypothetical protein C8R45DRAFT_1159552 [Mycena sanguinolenta]
MLHSDSGLILILEQHAPHPSAALPLPCVTAPSAAFGRSLGTGSTSSSSSASRPDRGSRSPAHGSVRVFFSPPRRSANPLHPTKRLHDVARAPLRTSPRSRPYSAASTPFPCAPARSDPRLRLSIRALDFSQRSGSSVLVLAAPGRAAPRLSTTRHDVSSFRRPMTRHDASSLLRTHPYRSHTTAARHRHDSSSGSFSYSSAARAHQLGRHLCNPHARRLPPMRLHTTPSSAVPQPRQSATPAP